MNSLKLTGFTTVYKAEIESVKWNFHFLTKQTFRAAPCKSLRFLPPPQALCSSLPPGSSSPFSIQRATSGYPSPLEPYISDETRPGGTPDAPRQPMPPKLNSTDCTLRWGLPPVPMASGFKKNSKGGPHWETTPPEISKLVNKIDGDLQLVEYGVEWAVPILIRLMMYKVLWMVTILAKDGMGNAPQFSVTSTSLRAPPAKMVIIERSSSLLFFCANPPHLLPFSPKPCRCWAGATMHSNLG